MSETNNRFNCRYVTVRFRIFCRIRGYRILKTALSRTADDICKR
ncbi:hypothetical protein HMPREF3214_00853 [Alloscardovia omnicolens]|nr:hypothetical protein HMPREF3214_00853 [Alloscardovia omnicolens]